MSDNATKSGVPTIVVPLGDGLEAKVDARDEWVTGWRWGALQINGRRYAARRVPSSSAATGSTTVLLHREIAGATEGSRVRFRDGDSLNCRRDNLELRKGVV